MWYIGAEYIRGIPRDPFSSMRLLLTPKLKRSITSTTAIAAPPDWETFMAGCKMAGGKALSPFEYQRDICRKLCEGTMKSGMVVKSRQLGLTLTTALTMAYQAQTEPGIQLSAVSIRQEDASAIGKRIRKAAGHQLSIASDNVLELALTNGSLVKYLSAGASDPGRGDTNVRGIFLDEAAFYDYRNLLGALAGGTLWAENPWQLTVTTPSHVEHEFYEEFTRPLSAPYEDIVGRILEGSLPPYYSEEISPGVHRIFIHFTAVPMFAADPNRYLSILINLGLSPAHVQREANLAWGTESAASVFDGRRVSEAIAGLYEGDLTGDVCVGIDPAGFGRDKFAIVIFRANHTTGLIQVLRELTWDSYDGSAITAELERQLTQCSGSITIEANGVGAGFVDLMLEDPRFLRFDIRLITTTKLSKSRAIAFTEWLVSSKRVRIYTQGLPTQMKRFTGDRAGKASRGGDDLVLALLIGLNALDLGGGFTSWYQRFWLSETT